MNFKKLPIWMGVSWILYIHIRLIEYTTGQVGTPEWIVDFIPIVLPFIFVGMDNLFFHYDKGVKKR